MDVRPVNTEDYKELSEWWASWGWEHPPAQDFLSNIGVMVSDGGVNICAGFLYPISSAPIGWFTLPVSNRAVRGQKRKDAIYKMIESISDMCKDMGIKYIYSSLRNPSMIDAQKRAGFIQGDINHTELFKIITWEQQ